MNFQNKYTNKEKEEYLDDYRNSNLSLGKRSIKTRIERLRNNHKECGFPESALPKVKTKLENNKINYLVIDRRNNYDVDEQENYKDLNNYEKIFEKANREINRNKRIERLSDFLDRAGQKNSTFSIKYQFYLKYMLNWCIINIHKLKCSKEWEQIPLFSCK